MKPIHILLVLMLLSCQTIFGEQSQTVSHPQTTTQVVCNQQETIQQLQAKIEAMEKQQDDMDKAIDRCSEIAIAKSSEVDSQLSHWLTIIGIIAAIIVGIIGMMVTIVGIAVPLVLNKRNEKAMDRMLEDVKQQNKELKKHVTEIEEKIIKEKEAAEKAAKEAEASKLFSEAFAEKDSQKAIELYTKVLKIVPNSSNAYNNRGIAKFEIGDLDGALADYNDAIKLDSHKAEIFSNRGSLKAEIGDLDGALADYKDAIKLDSNYKSAYHNRMLCYQKLAKVEKDPEKKKEYMAKAEADKKKYEELKNKETKH